MKVENNKIVEATRDELFDYYLTRDWDSVMSFPEFARRCEEHGTKITKEAKSKGGVK